MIPTAFRFYMKSGLGISLLMGLPMAAPEEVPMQARKDCLSVELMMYSGRPRPKYLLCEENEKKEVLEKLAATRDPKPASTPYPELESTPNYQGILLTLPQAGPGKPTRILLRKGFIKDSDEIRLDRDRALEKFFLKRSTKEKDISDSPTHGATLEAFSNPILEEMEKEGAQK